MIRNFHAALLGAVLFAPACMVNAQAQDSGKTPLVTLIFTNTDAANVLNAIGRKAHVNILVPEEAKATVSVRFHSVPVEEAVLDVAALAGLVCRQCQRNLHRGEAEAMRAVLEQVGVSKRVNVEPFHLDATAAASALTKAFSLSHEARDRCQDALADRGAERHRGGRNGLARDGCSRPAPEETAVGHRPPALCEGEPDRDSAEKCLSRLTILAVNDSTLILTENEPDSPAALGVIKQFDALPAT